VTLFTSHPSESMFTLTMARTRSPGFSTKRACYTHCRPLEYKHIESGIMFSEEVIRSLTELIQYLNSHPKLSPEEASDRYRRYFRNVFDRMVHSGESYGQATGAPGMVMPTGDEAEFRKRLTAIDNDLREQVRIVREGVQHYFGNGEYPAPYYAWRIASFFVQRSNTA
jgi:hypothetical protein